MFRGAPIFFFCHISLAQLFPRLTAAPNVEAFHHKKAKSIVAETTSRQVERPAFGHFISLHDKKTIFYFIEQASLMQKQCQNQC